MTAKCNSGKQEAELEAALFGNADAIEGFGLEAAAPAPAPVWIDDDDDDAAAPDEMPSVVAAAGSAVALWEDRRGDAGTAGWVAPWVWHCIGRSLDCAVFMVRASILSPGLHETASACAPGLVWNCKQSSCCREPADVGADAVVGRKRRGGAVWEDPDDAEVEVAVAGRPRLRKLRHTEDEAVLSGEYLVNGSALPILAIGQHSRLQKVFALS